MAWWIYVVIIFVIVSVLGFLLFYFQVRTEEKQDYTMISKDRLDDMASTFDILIELAKDNEKLKEKISLVQDKIRYSTPSESKIIAEKDRRIEERISDLKLKLARAKVKGTYYGCERLLTEIELLIVERNTKAK